MKYAPCPTTLLFQIARAKQSKLSSIFCLVVLFYCCIVAVVIHSFLLAPVLHVPDNIFDLHVHEIKLKSITSEVVNKMMNENVIKPNSITLVENENRNSEQGKYSVQDLARTLSHLNAILLAYQQNLEIALILEDQVVLKQNFHQDFQAYLATAPADWTILQLDAPSQLLRKHVSHLKDPWVSSLPSQGLAGAYIINREGMGKILRALLDVPIHSAYEGAFAWNFNERALVLAEEILWFHTKCMYTSTYSWIYEAGTKSEMRRKNYDSISEPIDMIPLQKSSKRILVLMNVSLKSIDAMHLEIIRLKADAIAMASFHSVAMWQIRVVASEEAILDAAKEAMSSILPSIQCTFDIKRGNFNKYEWVRTNVAVMKNYDVVLLKDSDQRIAGVPWRTFLEQAESSIIAGPLRLNIEEDLSRSKRSQNQWYKFLQAVNWIDPTIIGHDVHEENVSWFSDRISNVDSLQVPFLEQYFVLMDASFASWYFPLILTEDFVKNLSDWGPDFTWCAAAEDYDQRDGKSPCTLVPVISVHDDTRQINKITRSFQQSNDERIIYMRKFPQLRTWMRKSNSWRRLIGNKFLPNQIRERCTHAAEGEPVQASFEGSGLTVCT